MASTGVNVLRYTALGAGLFYGLYHQAAITAQTKLAQIDREQKHQQDLIARAKIAYKEKIEPSSKNTKGGVITDPEDKNFDLEAYLKTLQ